MKKVVIFGNESTAHDCFYQAHHFSGYDVAGFTVDKAFMKDDRLFGLPVVAFDEVVRVFEPGQHLILIAVGYVKNNRIRKERYLQAKQMGYECFNLVSPNAIHYPENLIGENCIIGHYTVISQSARIGHNVIIGSGGQIGHDVVIGDNCFLSSGVLISGSVNIGESCYLGAGCIIRNKVSIGNGSVIGAGAIVFENAKDHSVYLGESAKLLPISSKELQLG